MTPQDVWDLSRDINKWTGGVVVCCVLWRLIPQVLDRRRWALPRAVHLIAWFTWISCSIGNATAGAFVSASAPTWTSATRLLLNVAAVALCVWWPHPPRYVPIEEAPHARPVP